MDVLPANVAENLPELWTVANLISRMDPRIVLDFLIALSRSTVSPPKKKLVVSNLTIVDIHC